MPGFGSVNTALSALRYARTAMDVSSENVANLRTPGYTRRQVDSVTAGGAVAPAMWFRSSGVGEGVAVSGVSRVTDELLNVRGRREAGTQSYLDIQAGALSRVEDGLAEPGDSGLSTALADFRKAWGALAMGTTVPAARVGVLSDAAGVVDAVRTQLAHVQGEANDQRGRAVLDVSEVNAVATDLARTNVAIVSGALNGSDVNTLRDTRDQLATRLAELTGATTTLRPDGSTTVAVGTAVLVDGASVGSFSIASGVTDTGEADGAPLTFAVTSPGGSTTTVGAGGELGGVARLVDVHLGGYLTDLAAVVGDIAATVNAQHRAGYDASGTAGTDLFTFDPADVLGTFSVAIDDPALLAASAVPGGGSDGENAAALAELTQLGASYQGLVTRFGSQVQQANRQVATQQVLTKQIETARQGLGGVDLDEEMVELTLLQRQYEASARLMTTVDSMLDTLINRTGLLR